MPLSLRERTAIPFSLEVFLAFNPGFIAGFYPEGLESVQREAY